MIKRFHYLSLTTICFNHHRFNEISVSHVHSLNERKVKMFVKLDNLIDECMW